MSSFCLTVEVEVIKLELRSGFQLCPESRRSSNLYSLASDTVSARTSLLPSRIPGCVPNRRDAAKLFLVCGQQDSRLWLIRETWPTLTRLGLLQREAVQGSEDEDASGEDQHLGMSHHCRCHRGGGAFGNPVSTAGWQLGSRTRGHGAASSEQR